MALPNVPIGDLTENCSTCNPRLNESSDEFQYIDLSSVDKDEKAITNVEWHLRSEAPSRARQLVHEEDVLVATVRPNLNGVAIVEKAHHGMTASTGYCVLRAIPERLDARFLFQWVRTPTFVRKMVDVASGANYPAVSDAKVKASTIPLPPLAEQKRIAAILDAADALRAKRRQTLAELDTLLQSTFLDMFGDPVTNPKGWEVGSIGDLLESANYGTSKKADEMFGEFPVLRMNNITYSGTLDLSNLKYIDLSPREKKQHLVHKGQLLFNRTNSKELVGKTAVFRDSRPMAFAGYLVRGVVGPHADAEYIGAFMNTQKVKTYLRSKCKNIVGMANINAKEFQAIPIPKPPLSLQQQFADVVESVEQQKTRLRAHLAELDTLFAALQSRAFKGEL